MEIVMNRVSAAWDTILGVIELAIGDLAYKIDENGVHTWRATSEVVKQSAGELDQENAEWLDRLRKEGTQ